MPNATNEQLRRGIFGDAYGPDERDRRIFGDAYVEPAEFVHGEWTLVARIEKATPDGDGQPVEIDESRLPARFFRLRALPDTNSIGRPRLPFVLSTGSGDEMGHLMMTLARAIASGMVGFHEEEKTDA